MSTQGSVGGHCRPVGPWAARWGAPTDRPKRTEKGDANRRLRGTGLATEADSRDREADSPNRVSADARLADALAFLTTQVWPLIPPGERSRVMIREEEDELLGYGPDGF